MNVRTFFPSIPGCGVVAAGFWLSMFSVLGAVPGDEHWDVQFGAPGVTNIIFAVAVNNGLVYAAGLYPSGSLRTNTPLNVWDGRQWSVPAMFHGPIQNGISSMQVNDLAFVGNTLYAAGSFTNVNGVTANGLARWDGTSWSGVGFSGIAYALAVDGTNLYVGGSFTNAGGVTTTNIGCWDGSAWHALGDGLGVPGLVVSVQAIAVKSGAVYAGGAFYNSGSQPVTNLAVWNGSAWSAVGGGANGGVVALTFKGNDLYVGGYFSQAGTMPASGIAKWDGANWSALGSGLSGGSAAALSIAVLNGTVCVAGAFASAGGLHATNFATWDGSSWSAAAGNLNGVGYRAVASGTNLYVGGSFTAAGGVWANQVAAWDGTRWSAFGIPGRLNGLLTSSTILSSITALANDGTNLYAGGNFSYAGSTNASFIARFEGRNWKPLGAGLNNQVTALAVANNKVYAGGYFTGTADGHTSLSYIGCWDGTNWNSLGNAGGVVFALAVSSNGLYAAGTGYDGAQYYSPYFSRWDGTNWYNAVNFTNDCTFFTWPLNYHDSTGYCALAIQGTNIYLGGNIRGFSQFDPVLGPGFSPFTNCLNIIRFDPNFGWVMGAGLNNYPVALAALGPDLFAAGAFTSADGVAANQLARWDGNNWSSVNGSVIGSGTVRALTTVGNRLYAGGTFTNIGGVTASHIAQWDGTNWSVLGSGISGTVSALAAFGSNVYAGGTVRQAGDKFAYNVGRWNGQMNFNIPQLINPAWLTNKQFGVRLMGVGGLTNIIQATTNFTAWTPVWTNSTGVYDFTDPDSAAYPRRFYRALLGP